VSPGFAAGTSSAVADRAGFLHPLRTARLESLLAQPGDSPSGHAQRHEQELMLADALAELPKDYREVIILRHIEGLPFEEVAVRMERSSGAVRTDSSC
jgi:RNA polymerase sigma-70 factor, ECF subfamily